MKPRSVKAWECRSCRSLYDEKQVAENCCVCRHDNCREEGSIDGLCTKHEVEQTIASIKVRMKNARLDMANARHQAKKLGVTLK